MHNFWGWGEEEDEDEEWQFGSEEDEAAHSYPSACAGRAELHTQQAKPGLSLGLGSGAKPPGEKMKKGKKSDDDTTS